MRTCPTTNRPCDCPGTACPLDVASDAGGMLPYTAVIRQVEASVPIALLAGTDGVDVDLWVRPGSAPGRLAGTTTLAAEIVDRMPEASRAALGNYLRSFGCLRVGRVRLAWSQVEAIASQIETVLALHAPAVEPSSSAPDMTPGTTTPERG